MAIFAFTSESWSRLDYSLLQGGGIHLYYSDGVLQEDLGWLRAEKYVIHEFDCMTWKTEEGFHADVAKVLKFPSYYGKNLDAFNDCMGDLEVPSEGGVVLLFRAVDSVDFRQGKFFWTVLDILIRVSRGNLFFGRRLIVILQSRNPKIEFEPIGAVPVTWNSREWLNSKRGL